MSRIFVSSRALEREKIMSIREKSNLRPSVSAPRWSTTDHRLSGPCLSVIFINRIYRYTQQTCFWSTLIFLCVIVEKLSQISLFYIYLRYKFPSERKSYQLIRSQQEKPTITEIDRDAILKNIYIYIYNKTRF